MQTFCVSSVEKLETKYAEQSKANINSGGVRCLGFQTQIVNAKCFNTFNPCLLYSLDNGNRKTKTENLNNSLSVLFELCVYQFGAFDKGAQIERHTKH